jgi:hypothetical protein
MPIPIPVPVLMTMPMPMLVVLGLCLTGGFLALVLVCFCEVAGSQVNTHLLFRFLGRIANGVPIVFCVFLAGLWGACVLFCVHWCIGFCTCLAYDKHAGAILLAD